MPLRKTATRYEVVHQQVTGTDPSNDYVVLAHPLAGGDPRVVASFPVGWWGEDVAKALAYSTLATISVYVLQ